MLHRADSYLRHYWSIEGNTLTGITSIFAADGRIRRNQSVQLFANVPFRAFFLGNLTNATGVELRVMA